LGSVEDGAEEGELGTRIFGVAAAAHTLAVAGGFNPMFFVA
jgi:hypothetical protein